MVNYFTKWFDTWRHDSANQSRPFTREEFPTLFDKVEVLKQRVQADYPDETLPEIAIIPNPQPKDDKARVYYGEEIYKRFAKAEEKYAAYMESGLGEDSYEKLFVSEALVADLPEDQSVGIIAHEIGHDIVNDSLAMRNASNREKKISECRADFVAARYANHEARVAYFRERERDLELPLPASTQAILGVKTVGEVLKKAHDITHPEPAERISLARNPAVQNYHVEDLEFSPNCTFTVRPKGEGQAK